MEPIKLKGWIYFDDYVILGEEGRYTNHLFFDVYNFSEINDLLHNHNVSIDRINIIDFREYK